MQFGVPSMLIESRDDSGLAFCCSANWAAYIQGSYDIFSDFLSITTACLLEPKAPTELPQLDFAQ